MLYITLYAFTCIIAMLWIIQRDRKYMDITAADLWKIAILAIGWPFFLTVYALTMALIAVMDWWDEREDAYGKLIIIPKKESN